MTRKFLTISAMCAALLCSVVSIQAETAVQRHGKLKTKGGYLLNEHDSIVQLRGMSFFWTTPGWNGTQWYNAGTVDALVDTWKCTVVRLAFDTQNGWNDLCVPVLNRCIEKGIYVIIDWHSHNAETQEAAATNFFKEQAAKYKNTPNVIFEPYNEPKWAGGAQPEVGNLENALKTWGAIKGYLKNVTKAIRAAGADNLVILGTPYYAQFVNVAANDPVLDDGNKPFANVAYSFHFYAASHGQFAYYVTNPDASGKKSGGMEPMYLGPAIGKVPVFVTEWGTTHSDGGEGFKNTYIDATNTDWWFTNYIDKNHISHCNWSATGFQPSSAFSGSASSPSASGTVAKKYIATSTKDYWANPELFGKRGPAGDSAFTMPGTKPAIGYNLYNGANFSGGNLPFLLRDEKAMAKTSLNTALTVSSDVTSSEWIEYNIKSSVETKSIILRYLAFNGSGSLDILLDGKKLASVTLEKTSADSSWSSKLVPAVVAAGDHKLRLSFTGATGTGYFIQWVELTNGTSVSKVLKHFSVTDNISISQSRSGLTLSLSESHPYQSYKLHSIDGRTLLSAPIANGVSTLTIGKIPTGTYLVSFIGKENSSVRKIIVNSK
jgi:endoglucanase